MRTQIRENENSLLAHTNPTPPNSIYIWTNLSLFPLQSSGRVAYMKTHPTSIHYTWAGPSVYPKSDCIEDALEL